MTTIVDYIDGVTLSYDHGTETRIYHPDGTFELTNDWTEIGYSGTLEKVVAQSKGDANGRYTLNGSMATYSNVSSIGNWTKSVDGVVRSQSSVVFSSGQETVTCSSGSLKVEDPGSYVVRYSRA